MNVIIILATYHICAQSGGTGQCWASAATGGREGDDGHDETLQEEAVPTPERSRKYNTERYGASVSEPSLKPWNYL